jgi:Tfp pilus assembly protein PilN
MKLPAAIFTKTIARFDSLIEEGRNILASAQDVPASTIRNRATGVDVPFGKAYKRLDAEKFIEWRTKVATLLALIVPKGHVHRQTVEELPKLQDSQENLQEAVSLLRGVKDDFEQGFLDDLATAIEAEIASNYMGQAEHLLAEGQRGKFDHVPAAVLAGAVLENSLRTICGQQQQPIAINNSNGDFKTLSPLVDDLKRAGVFNEAKAKQLRAWADIRNLAAHGEFTQFTRSDVEAMISGINNFLADHLI